MNIKNDIKARIVQKMVFKKLSPGRKINSFSSAKATEKNVTDEGILYANDIEYGKVYPNSFLDIWYASEDITQKRPTIVYFHGGGFLFGDKIMGDPLAKFVSADLGYYKDLAKRGYNVVSGNYCFAPKYRAPAQILQLDHLFDFLNKNAAELGLDMDNVILMGGSAGANIAAIYGLALCDHGYAAKLGFTPSVKKEQVKALVIDENCLMPESIVIDKNMLVLMSAWIGSVKLDKNELARLLDVASQIKSDYIPSYITASNVEASFEMSAKSLKEKLDKIRVDYDYYFVPKEDSEELHHGFMGNFSANKYSAECYERMLAFIEKHL